MTKRMTSVNGDFMKYHAWPIGVAIVVLFLSMAAMADERLSLDAYMQQVQAQNEGVKSQQQISEGAQQRSSEGDLETALTLFSNANYTEDDRPQVNPLAGTRTTVKQFSLGVSKVFDFGLQAKLYEQITSTNIGGVPAFPPPFNVIEPVTNYTDAAPVIELRLPLWKNGFGRDVDARREQTNANATKLRYDDSYKAKQTIASAESAYWQLALAQELSQIQKDTLDRQRALRDWSARRTKDDLADKGDYLQADAAFRLAELSLTQAQNDLRVAARGFNSARGIDSDDVKETLAPIDSDSLDHLKAPARAKFRDDVKAALANQKVSQANAALGREKNAPTFDVYAQYSLTGRDNSVGSAVANSYNLNYPYTQVGVQFSLPLDFGLLADDRAGYLKEQRGAELEYSRKVFDQENEWKDLVQKLTESQTRLSLARQIESVQREKVDHEKLRLHRAQTTTFQVLQFETDYNTARVNHLRAANEVLNLVAKMKVFGGSDDAR